MAVSKVLRIWTCAALFVLVGGQLDAHAQLIDVYKQAADALRGAAAQSPMNAQCYLAMASRNDCLAASLTGGSPNCVPAACSIAPVIPGGMPTQLMGGVAGLARGGAGAATRGGGALGFIADHQQEIMQSIQAAQTLFKVFSGLRKRHKAKRDAQPLPRGDARAEQEVLRMQEMAQEMARQRAEIERAADLLLARADNLLTSADALLASADAMTPKTTAAGDTAATPVTAPAKPAAPGAGVPAGTSITGRPSSTASPTSIATSSQPGDGTRATSEQRGSDIADVRPSENRDSCLNGWAAETFAVSAYGNDDLWLKSAALATITDESGRASTVGRFLSIEYTTGRKTRIFVAAPGSGNFTLSAGESRRLPVSTSSDGSVSVSVRYCKE